MTNREQSLTQPRDMDRQAAARGSQGRPGLDVRTETAYTSHTAIRQPTMAQLHLGSSGRDRANDALHSGQAAHPMARPHTHDSKHLSAHTHSSRTHARMAT
jgi:hypothetical protein